uniref:UDP-glycosyltransferase n=1 Tax=Timema poppense TaxID=170557 RepID=A0A7R9H0X2_TIMPO|nr:unnamed protein product [Timema poppensis]
MCKVISNTPSEGSYPKFLIKSDRLQCESNTLDYSSTGEIIIPLCEDGGIFRRGPLEWILELKDLQRFMDDARHGVIYMSLGTNLPSAYLPPEKIAAFIDIFTQLKQKVLWKWENGTLSGRPPNVKVAKWFPQQDILGA